MDRTFIEILISRSGAIAQLVLNRPHDLNALSPTLIHEALEAITEVAANNPGSVAAYKTLYRAAENEGLEAGLAFEAAYRPPRRDDGQPRQPLSAHLARS